jgi:hypothetical protein
MPIKHQSNCYRNIKGVRYENYSDLIYGDEDNERIIKQAQALYKLVRKIKHPDGYYQLFVNHLK